MYKRFSVLILAAAIACAATAVIFGGPAVAPPPGKTLALPPNATVHGKTLAQWLEGYWRWYYGEEGAIEVTPHQPGVAPIVYMPIPAGVPQYEGSGTAEDPERFVGSIDVTLKTGTMFVMPCFAWISERYNTGQPDDAYIENDRIQFTVINVSGTGAPEVTLDGKPILQDFWAYYVGPFPFDPVVEYPAPSPYGSIAAIYYQSTGFIMKPLTPGKHTIHLLERIKLTDADLPGYDIGLIYDNTWNIEVKPGR